MELELTLIAGIVTGYLLCAHLIARRRKCSTSQVVRETWKILRGDPGEERSTAQRGDPGEER